MIIFPDQSRLTRDGTVVLSLRRMIGTPTLSIQFLVITGSGSEGDRQSLELCDTRTPTNLTGSEASRRHDYDFLLPIDKIHTGLNSFDDPALAHSRFPQNKQTELLALGFAVGMVFPGQRLR